MKNTKDDGVDTHKIAFSQQQGNTQRATVLAENLVYLSIVYSVSLWN